jgi:hypothetical protein
VRRLYAAVDARPGRVLERMCALIAALSRRTLANFLHGVNPLGAGRYASEDRRGCLE